MTGTSETSGASKNDYGSYTITSAGDIFKKSPLKNRSLSNDTTATTPSALTWISSEDFEDAFAQQSLTRHSYHAGAAVTAGAGNTVAGPVSRSRGVSEDVSESASEHEHSDDRSDDHSAHHYSDNQTDDGSGSYSTRNSEEELEINDVWSRQKDPSIGSVDMDVLSEDDQIYTSAEEGGDDLDTDDSETTGDQDLQYRNQAVHRQSTSQSCRVSRSVDAATGTASSQTEHIRKSASTDAMERYQQRHPTDASSIRSSASTATNSNRIVDKSDPIYKLRKRHRKRVVRGIVGGAVAGVVLGPVGVVIGGAAGGMAASKYAKSAEKKEIRNMEKQVLKCAALEDDRLVRLGYYV